MPRQTISVITPAHSARLTNGKLTRATESVYAQTLPPDGHIVAIDVDRQGAAATRQRALALARTYWVAFLDSDDILKPRHLEWLMNHAQETGADFCYAWFDLLLEYPDGRSVIRAPDENGDGVFPPGHFLNDFDPEHPIETTITTLVKTELAQSVGFRPMDRGERNSGEDYSFLLGCLKAGAKVSHLKRRSWFWSHWSMPNGTQGNTSGMPTKGDAA